MNVSLLGKMYICILSQSVTLSVTQEAGERRPEPEHEAVDERKSPELGEGAGRLPQGVRQLRGDVGLGGNRWVAPLETETSTG